MKQVFLKWEGNPRLLLFFAGWGADERLFNRPVAQGYDCLLCFDYRTPDFDAQLLDGYAEIYLLAWSMGVWMASRTLAQCHCPVVKSLAVNGTLCPIDDAEGIPHAVFEGTLQGFSADTLVRFRRRMCGSPAEVKAFLSHAPYRLPEELRDELEALKQAIDTEETPAFCWNKALIGMEDRIFPAENQRRAWQETEVETRGIAHYNEQLFNDLLSGKEEAWIKP